jgi:hypothetical protein
VLPKFGGQVVETVPSPPRLTLSWVAPQSHSYKGSAGSQEEGEHTPGPLQGWKLCRLKLKSVPLAHRSVPDVRACLEALWTLACFGAFVFYQVLGLTLVGLELVYETKSSATFMPYSPVGSVWCGAGVMCVGGADQWKPSVDRLM